MHLNSSPASRTTRGKASHGQSVPPLLMPVAGIYFNKLATCRSALVEIDRHEREVAGIKAAHLAYFAKNKPTEGGDGGQGYV